jgi:hypothetical protein
MPGVHEEIEEVLFKDEENGLSPIRTSNFEGTLQEESMSGLLDCTPAFRKSFLSGYLETDSKESRDVVNACEHGGISGRDGNIERKDFEDFEISAKSESDITFQATGSRKSSKIVPSKKIIGSKLKSDVRADKASAMKRETIVRSSYFCSKTTDNVDLKNAEIEFIPRREEVSHTAWDVDTGHNTIKGNCSSEQALDGVNVSTREQHNNDTRKANNRKGARLDDAITTSKRNHIPTFRSDLTSNSMQQEKFACDLSHLEQYSVIAEQSMERFVSTISSFRCSAGGARASGLRAPLKSATTQKSVGALKQTGALKGDFSKFAYQSNNCNSRPASQIKPIRSARPTVEGEELSASEFGR